MSVHRVKEAAQINDKAQREMQTRPASVCGLACPNCGRANWLEERQPLCRHVHVSRSHIHCSGVWFHSSAPSVDAVNQFLILAARVNTWSRMSDNWSTSVVPPMSARWCMIRAAMWYFHSARREGRRIVSLLPQINHSLWSHQYPILLNYNFTQKYLNRFNCNSNFYNTALYTQSYRSIANHDNVCRRVWTANKQNCRFMDSVS